MSAIICGDPGYLERGLYVIGYTDTTSGYRHAYLREVPGSRTGRTEVHLTRSKTHPADPRCPGCAELRGEKQP